jgi:nicotinamide-nucleotide amidase
MRCDVVAIGTELLLGQIVDTNSSWIGEQLALSGIDCHFQVKVGDNFARMKAAILAALERADAVICCGGLGPTQDDITREVIADIMGAPLVRDEAIVKKIRAMFEARGRAMSDNNKRQADIPQGATAIAQMPGTAPGLLCPIGDKVIYAVPGVPYEMHEMMLGTILPDLRARSGEAAVIVSRVLRTWGQSESGLAEQLDDRIRALDGSGNPTLAFLASGIEGIKVRITAKAAETVTAERLLAAEEANIRALIGDIVFAIDDQTMEDATVARLSAASLTLAAAEGLTGGLLASRLTRADPGMAVFRGATVAPDAGARPGADGEARALAAAQAARQRFATDVAVAACGPEAGEDLPAGTVFLAAVGGAADRTATVALPGDRRRLRDYAVISLLDLLRKTPLPGEGA